ncbi:Hypothetical protein NTJ_02413 [Nesidiocoris tenuis]|uniref:Lipocalin/cytosolic fatty-acid binding domain-containing protein n=1 Tax=Nesidiocoris tenuis TaxID=355587 RepID=A0ABN7ABA7_9HEMI|nr:Hypothetical protein NTJ_02413 [Nesidiocoris tenuis]
MYRIVLLLAVAALATVEGQEWIRGTCAKSKNVPVRLVPSPNLIKKTLFLRNSFNNYLFDRDDAKCSMLYGVTDRGTDLYGYYIQAYNETSVDVRLGITDLSDSVFTSSSVMNTKFDQIKGGLRDVIIPLQLIASDGENFGVLYSCRQAIGPIKLEMALAYTAKAGDDSYDEIIKTAVENVGVDYSQVKVAQQAC